jgi:hypothetical protein
MRRGLLLAIVACGHPAPAAQPPRPAQPIRALDAAPPLPLDAPLALEDDLPRLATRAVHLFEDWRKALDDAHGDCTAAAKAVDAVADSYADVIAANTRVLHAGHARVVALKTALKPYDADMDAAAAGIAADLQSLVPKCESVPELGRALDRVGGAPP